MSRYLIVDGDPRLVLHDAAEPAEAGWRMRRLLAVSARRTPLGGENANIAVDLDNRDGRLSTLWATPPHRAAAAVYDGTELLLSGVITTVSIGLVVSVTVEA